MGISFSQKGNWDKTDKWLRKHQKISLREILEPYGEIGLQALRNATPVKTGKTRDSWYYTIDTSTPGRLTINWCNSNINEGVNIAVIIQYGHGTRGGTYIEGTDYINPVMKPIFDSLSNRAFKEVVTAYGN